MGTGTDNWDQHWQEFGAVAELGPTPKYRRRLIWKLLDIGGQGESVRMLEVVHKIKCNVEYVPGSAQTHFEE